MNTKEALLNYILRLGDDALIIGHRLSEWCSRGPILEEDLALTNLSLDYIGRAQALLKYAAELKGNNYTEDDIAYRRPESLYYNHLIVETPNKDFAHTMVRQLFVSAFEFQFFDALQKSKDPQLAAISAKTLKEVKYHLAHATDWVIRLGDGSPESHDRMQKAVNQLWMFTGELFEMTEVDFQLLKEGITFDLVPIQIQWQELVADVLNKATLHQPTTSYMQSGGLQGKHTEHMGHILSEMQYLQRAYPDAKW